MDEFLTSAAAEKKEMPVKKTKIKQYETFKYVLLSTLSLVCGIVVWFAAML